MRELRDDPEYPIPGHAGATEPTPDVCPKCGGTLRDSGVTLTSHPPIHFDVCAKCGHSVERQDKRKPTPDVRHITEPLFIQDADLRHEVAFYNHDSRPILIIDPDRVLRLGEGVTCQEAAVKFVDFVNAMLRSPEKTWHIDCGTTRNAQ